MTAHTTHSPEVKASPRSKTRILVAVAIAMALVFVIAAGRMALMVLEHRKETVGDGRNVETYLFDLSTTLVPRDDIIASGMAKNSLHTLDAPTLWTPDDVERYNEERRGKYLVPSDLVIGVSLEGEARAYPLRVLVWHEAVNDELGGVPIVATYNFLSDSVAVYDRRVDEETLEFGFSGLLYNSNALYYDRKADGIGESLWSQLQGRALTGPAAERKLNLKRISSQRVRWDQWVERHPHTTVIEPNLDRMRLYQGAPGGRYFGSDDLRFPVEPLSPDDGLPLKHPMVVLGKDGEWFALPLEEIAQRVDDLGVWNTEILEEPVRFTYQPRPESVWVETEELRFFHCARFAWYAHFNR